MKQLSIFFFVFILNLLTFIKPAHASCEIGETVFRDTLYGAGIGAGVGGLVLLANSDSKNIGPTMATGALVGVGLGVATGIIEVSLSGCGNREAKNDSSRLKFSPMFAVLPKTVFQDNVLLQKEVPFAISQVSPGLNVTLQLN
jgi:hypothetical protein